MLDWIAEKLLAMLNSVPGMFFAEDSPKFMLVRAMFALILVVLIVWAIAMLRPFCRAVARYASKAFDLIMKRR
jgi:hypothetical protein